jgi:hypothetical protein
MDYWLFGFPRISTWVQWGASQKLAPATPAERKLVEAVRTGEICGLGDEPPTSPTEETKIRGALLAYILRGGCPKFKATLRGRVYFSRCLFNGRIAGRDALLSEFDATQEPT